MVLRVVKKAILPISLEISGVAPKCVTASKNHPHYFVRILLRDIHRSETFYQMYGNCKNLLYWYEDTVMDALLIDDNTLYHALIVETLYPEGIDVYLVSGTASAREVLSRMTLHLVLWDPYAHGINGLAIVAKLHERHPSLPIIAVSRHSPSSLIQQQILTYTSYCLVKPFTKEALLQVCRHAIDLKKVAAAGAS